MARLLGSAALGLLLCFGSILTTADEINWQCPDEGFAGMTLNIHNWTTYIAPDTIPTFEALCSVTVNYAEYDNDDTVLLALRQGEAGYDLVIPDNSTVATMIEEGLIAPINHSHIPNLKHVAPTFNDLAYDPGMVYSVPYQWGSIGIGYRVAAFDTPVTSWEDFFTYKGKTGWIDLPRTMLGIAQAALKGDPNSTDPAAIAAARNFLINHSANTLIVPDSEGQTLLAEGAIDMVIENSGDIFQLIASCACADYAFVLPEEGSNLWVDAMVIPIESPNQRLAEAFIDYILDPQVSAQISNVTAYATPNETAIINGLINDAYLQNPSIYPDAQVRARMFFLGDVDTETERLLRDAWDEIGLLLGR